MILVSTGNDRFSRHRFSGNLFGGIRETVLAETSGFADKLSGKMPILEEKWLVLFTGFEDTTALEDKKGVTVYPINLSLTILLLPSLICHLHEL